MKNRRLITWNSKEDCIVWHRARGTERDQMEEWVERSMKFGNYLSERTAFDIAESYDVNVY